MLITGNYDMFTQYNKYYYVHFMAFFPGQSG